MAANQLAITNFFTVSVQEASPGLGRFNTSNLAIFTDEAPNLSTFGSLGYAEYLSPTQVGIDFGTASRTFAMANAVFSQQPNILNGGGQLVIILIKNQVNHVAFSGTPASGTFEFVYATNPTAAINWSDTAAQIQTKLRAVAGLSEIVVTGSMATTLDIQMAGIYAPTALTTTANSLMTSAPVAITITITQPTANETLDAAITRTSTLVQYFGILANETADVIGQTDVLAAAAVIQALIKMGFFVSNQTADVAPGGLLDLLRSGTLNQSRGLFYDDSVQLNCLTMMSSYAGLGLSVDFTGSNTTINMNGKTLIGVQPDPAITQTILNSCITAGADTYASYQGIPLVKCSGTNSFFDQIYNRLAFAADLQIAGLNYITQTNTKIPQTESGMTGLKGAEILICEQYVTNQYLAPGTWTSPTTFGNQTLFYNAISQKGYYIYSTPISQQSAAARSARQAPLIQIAGKEAGAINTGNVIVTINP